MQVYESEEMYLETILLLQQRRSYVRAIDIAEELGYSRPSVSNAVHQLEKKGYLDINGTEICLTYEGRAKAEAVYERHQVITALFVSMGAGKSVAEENACRVEHVITDEMFSLIKSFIEKSAK
ncbi:MAG: metal-dependent transcriptional regulator [Candidatus Coproplasma sp.]